MTFETNKKILTTRTDKLVVSLLTITLLTTILTIQLTQVAEAATFTLDGQASCESSPFFGTWNGTDNSCTTTSTTITINAADSLQINSGITLILDSSVINNFGKLNNDGTITFPGQINNHGILDNFGTLNNEDVLENHAGGVFNNYGTINQGEACEFDVEAGSTFTNFGTINGAQAPISNSGDFINLGTINNVLDNFGNGGLLINNGTINNIEPGFMNNRPGGVFNNFGTINNNSNGTDSGLGSGFRIADTLNNFGLINNNAGHLDNLDLIDNQGTICGGTVVNSGTILGNSPEPTCTLGELKITKFTTGGDDTFAFNISGTTLVNPHFHTFSGTAMYATNVTNGTYSVQESLIPAGWTLNTASCDDGFSTFSGDTVSGIVIDTGSNIECTFENGFGVSPDSDGDGIFNEVDTLPNTFSNDFNDEGLGGITNGTIVTRGDQILTIKEEPNPDGVRIIADISGGLTPATVNVCGEIVPIALTPGDEIVVTCSSVTITVINGQVEISFNLVDGSEATTTLVENNTITFDQETSTFTAPATNTQTVIISVNGVDRPIEPGSSVSIPLQVARPDSDPSLRWVNGIGEEPCNDLETFNCVDEVIRDDNDYIQTIGLGKKNSDKQFYTLSDITDPLTSDGHVLRYTIREADVGSNPVKLDVILRQGQTVIASFHHENLPSSFTLIEQTLTSAQADSITDYSDLELTLDGNCDSNCLNSPGNREKIQVSWIEFAIMPVP